MRFGDVLVLRTRNKQRAVILRVDELTGRLSVHMARGLTPDVPDEALPQWLSDMQRIFLDAGHYLEMMEFLNDHHTAVERAVEAYNAANAPWKTEHERYPGQ